MAGLTDLQSLHQRNVSKRAPSQTAVTSGELSAAAQLAQSILDAVAEGCLCICGRPA